ncbi:MAG: hypothetical protein QM639_13695 [Rhodocyclaceae bacterium]
MPLSIPRLVPGIAALALAACASTMGPPRLQAGQTEAEVLAQAGQPAETFDNADGSRTLEYNNQPFGTTVYMVTLGGDGRVREVAQVLSDPYMARVKPGLTHDEVLRLLGRPLSRQTYPLSKEEAWEWNIDSMGYGGQLKRFDVIFKDGKVIRSETRFIDRYDCGGILGCFPN